MAADKGRSEKSIDIRPCPRPYRLGKRGEGASRKRLQVVQAARQLLLEGGPPAFTLEAVARQAGVTRQTVHNQFGSRAGLLEALLDSAALDAGLSRLPEVFGEPDPVAAVERLVEVFVEFWAANAEFIDRMNALAALDPEFAAVLGERPDRRRRILEALVGRLLEQHRDLACPSALEAVDTLFMLTSRASFEALARPERGPAEITQILIRLVRAALWLEPAGGG
jgi:AcrR family transcriptional regulator